MNIVGSISHKYWVKQNAYLKLLWLQLPSPSRLYQQMWTKVLQRIYRLDKRSVYQDTISFCNILTAGATVGISEDRFLKLQLRHWFEASTIASADKYCKCMCLLGLRVPHNISCCCNCRCNFCEPSVTTDVGVSVSEDRLPHSHTHNRKVNSCICCIKLHLSVHKV